MSVRSWPTYLLRDIPDEIRAAIEADAETEERSMAEIIREILCGHYELNCDPVEAFGPAPKLPGTNTMVLRVQPEVFSAVKADAARMESQYGAMRKVIFSILKAHYNGGHSHD